MFGFAVFALMVVVGTYQLWQLRPTKGTKLGWALGCALVAHGFLIFVGQFFYIYLVPTSHPAPISMGVTDIALDASGTVYVSTMNGRVQAFDEAGIFKFAIQLEVGVWSMVETTEDGLLLLARFGDRYRYDRMGRPQPLRTEDLEIERRFLVSSSRLERDLNGTLVSAAETNRIEVVRPDGSILVIHPSPYLMPLFLSPLFGFFLIVCGFGIVAVQEHSPRRKFWWQKF